MDFSTIEITSKKVRGNNVVFPTIEIASKKVRENDMDFSIKEITSKKYVEMTWKFVEIWSSKYRYNIHIESTSIRRCAHWRFLSYSSNNVCLDRILSEDLHFFIGNLTLIHLQD